MVIKVTSFVNSDKKIIVEEVENRSVRNAENLNDKLSSVMRMKKLLND